MVPGIQHSSARKFCDLDSRTVFVCKCSLLIYDVSATFLSGVWEEATISSNHFGHVCLSASITYFG